MAGSRLDKTVGDNGGRLHVSRSGSKQTTGAGAVTVESYDNMKQPALLSVGDGDEQQRAESERRAGKLCGFPEAPDLLILTSQHASGLRYPFKRQLELASRGFGYHRFCGSSGGRELWRPAAAVARWAPTCAGAHQNSAASLP